MKSLLLVLLGAGIALGGQLLWQKVFFPIPENSFRSEDVPSFSGRDFEKRDSEKIDDTKAMRYTNAYKLMLLKPIDPEWGFKPLQEALWEDYCSTCPTAKVLSLNIRRNAIEDMLKQKDTAGKVAEFILVYPGLNGKKLTFVLAPGDANGNRIEKRNVPAGDNTPVAYDELGTCPHPCKGFQ